MPEAPPTARPLTPLPHLSVRPTCDGSPTGGALPGVVWAATRHVACGVPAGLPAATPPAAPGESALGGKVSSWAGGPQPRGLAAAQASGAEEIGLEGWGGGRWRQPGAVPYDICPSAPGTAWLQAMSCPGTWAVPRAWCSLPCLGLTLRGPSWWCLGTLGVGPAVASAPPHVAPGLVRADPRCDARHFVPGLSCGREVLTQVRSRDLSLQQQHSLLPWLPGWGMGFSLC